MKRIFIIITLVAVARIGYAQSAGWQNNAQFKQLTAQAEKYASNNDNENAAKAYLAAFNLDKSNYAAANALAAVFNDMKDYPTGINWAKQVVDIKPGFAPAYVNLGTAYGGQKDYANAMQAFNQAIKLNPKNPSAQYSMGTLEQQTGNLTQAAVCYERALALDENYNDTFYKLAVVYNDLKDYNKADININKYLVSFPDSQKALELHQHIAAALRADFSFPATPATGKTLNDFIAKGWTIKDKVIGDLNGDKMPDAALVLEYYAKIEEKRDKDVTNEGHPRVLLILFKSANGYNLALQHNTFILRDGEGGMSDDPYDKMQIAKGF